MRSKGNNEFIMQESFDFNMINESKETGSTVDFFIYRISDDSIQLSLNMKQLLGLNCTETCYLSNIKSLIVGVDVPVFINHFDKWLNGDTSHIIQIRLVDSKNQIRTLQIKGNIRYDENQNIQTIYGAFFDISYLGN